jgi:LuxR family quorum-sensing system transcriptional regulator SolR
MDSGTGIAPKIETATRVTKRELEVLCLISEGLAAKEIARNLCISKRTVEFHTNNLLAKLQARNRVSLVNQGRRLGLIPFEPL